jgi:hypothetical protein
MMDGLIFHNIARLADAKTQARMIKSIREMSFAGSRRCYYGAANQQKIRLPIKFTMDNRYNVYFFENNIKFTIYATYWQYHPQPITMSSTIYAEYIKNGGLNIIIVGEANKEVCLKYDTSKVSHIICNVIRTKYDIIVGIGEKI